MRHCEAALLAEGIGLRWHPGSAPDVMVLDVPTSEAERAAAVLSDQLGEELKRAPSLAQPSPWTPLLLRPAFAVGLGMAAMTLASFWVAGGAAGASAWQSRGALVASKVGEGEWWRLVTAGTLHADAPHAVGNAGFFLVLAWAAAERLGTGAALLVWLLTAVCGFGASLTFGDVHPSVGASGGLYGLLGAAAGHGLRHSRLGADGRRGCARILGAAILFVAYTAFSPRANVAAHLGGFLAGLACGATGPRRVLPGAVQAAFAATATLATLGSWWLALAAGAQR